MLAIVAVLRVLGEIGAFQGHDYIVREPIAKLGSHTTFRRVPDTERIGKQRSFVVVVKGRTPRVRNPTTELAAFVSQRGAEGMIRDQQ